MIETQIAYVYDGKSFTSLEEIKQHFINRIGVEVVDKIDDQLNLNGAQQVKLLNLLLKPEIRESLQKYYGEVLEMDDNSEPVNLLDYE